MLVTKPFEGRFCDLVSQVTTGQGPSMFRFSGFGTERLEPQVLVILNNKVVNYALWEDAVVGRCDVPPIPN